MRRSLKDVLRKTKKSGNFLGTSQLTAGKLYRLRPVPFKLPAELPKEVKYGGVMLDERIEKHHFFLSFYMHYGFTQMLEGREQEVSKSYMCLDPWIAWKNRLARKKGKKTAKVRCPFCEYSEAMSDSENDKADQQIGRNTELKAKILMNVVDMETNQVMIFSFVQVGLAGRLDELIEMYGNLGHPKTGRVLMIRKTGQGFQTKYALDAGDRTPIPEYQGHAKNLIEVALQTERPPSVAAAREIIQEEFDDSCEDLGW